MLAAHWLKPGLSKPLRTALGIALLALSGQAAALGLGQIQVKSRVDQPLLAEIPIVSSDPAELEQLQARLASPDTFRRIGLEPPTGVAADLQFTVALDARGRPVIRVTSSQPVTQPLVTFLVEVDWGTGQLVREYSALLDTPRTVAAPAQPPIQAPTVAPSNVVARPVAAAPTPPPAEPAPTEAAQPEAAPPSPTPAEPTPADTTAIAPTPEPEPVAEPAPVAAPAPPSTPDTIAVAAGATLSQLAQPLTRGYTLDQAMLALLRANPDAFVRGNINLLKAGTVLRVPPAQDVATLSASEAAVVVRDHLSQWRAMSAPAPQPATVAENADQGRNTNNATTPTKRATPRVSEARLEIVPPATGAKTPGSRSGASAGGEGEMLRQELQQTKEDLAAKNAEVSDLKARVAELEKLQQDQAALIQMKDSKLAVAEQQLAKANAATTAAPAPATTVAQAKATQAQATQAQPAPQPQPASTPAWLWGGAGLVVLGLLAWLFSRRRRASAAEPAPLRRAYDTEAMAAGMPKTPDAVDDREPVQPDFDLEPEAPVAAPPPAFSEPAPRPGPSHWTSSPASLGSAPTWHGGGGNVAAPVAPQVADPVTPAQQLELARAYLDMGDDDAARVVLREVLDGRDPASRDAAARLLRDL